LPVNSSKRRPQEAGGVDELLESTGLSPVRNVTLRSFCLEWLAGKRLTVSHAAARRYQRALELLLQGVGLRADKPPSGVTVSDIAAYRDARLRENVAGGTLTHYIKAVRSMFNSARRALYARRRRRSEAGRCCAPRRHLTLPRLESTASIFAAPRAPAVAICRRSPCGRLERSPMSSGSRIG
jgi:hypothetical protein